jgi:two-component system response regulator PilR (NtrC family)
MGNILVCDDEAAICQMLNIALRKAGHRVETVMSGEAALKKLDAAAYDVVISDIRMPGVDGVEVLRRAWQACPECERIVITAHEEFEVAKRVAVQGGVFAFHVKGGADLPLAVANSVEKAMEKISLGRKVLAYRRDAEQHNSLDNIVGASPVMQKLRQTIRAIAPAGSTVLICGESGTGKELVARAIHACSPRAREPFVSINCGAFPETLLESELFGYVRGAFTGAAQNKRGLFEAADGGAIFLDEISEMSPSMQVKLLRVLQEHTVRPVGGTAEAPVDVRVIAATNKVLDEMVGQSQFREDLYYRISVIPILAPPLRDRGDDVELLANHFLLKYAAEMGKNIHRLAAESLVTIKGYDWPGNVRQLENTIERAVALAPLGETELRIDLSSELTKARAANAYGILNGSPGVSIPPQGIDMEAYVASVERSLLQSALRRSNGVQTRAATLLNLSYRSLRHMLQKYDL